MVEACVDTVLVSKPSAERAQLARIHRGDACWVLRGQFGDFFCGGNDRALKSRITVEDQSVTEDEFCALKALGAVSKHSSVVSNYMRKVPRERVVKCVLFLLDDGCEPSQAKCLAVPAREAAAAAVKIVPHSAARWVELAMARVLFTGIVPLPASMPPPEVEAEDDDDDDEASAEAEELAAEPRIYGLADFGGALAHQLEAMEAFCTEPLRIDRGGDVRLQSAQTWSGNIKPAICRFLGFCCTEASAERVREEGMFVFLDGSLIMRYLAFMLRVRGNGLTSLVSAIHALNKAAAFTLSTLEGDSVVTPAAREAYFSRLKLLAGQLQCWSTSAPRYKPTFAQLCESGTFVPLPDILGKSLPYITAGLAAATTPADSVAAAMKIRDLAVLAAVAGDGWPNVRPRELTYLRDQRLLPARGCNSLCLNPGCTFGPSCVGDFVMERSDGSLALHLTHHKNSSKSGPRDFDAPAGCTTTAAFKALIAAATLLRQTSGCRGLFLSKDGGFLTPSTFCGIATRELAAAGLKGQSARSVRRSVVVHGSDELDAKEQQGVAQVMGNSVRAWKNAYDVKASYRQSQVGISAYQSMVAQCAEANEAGERCETSLQPPLHEEEEEVAPSSGSSGGTPAEQEVIEVADDGEEMEAAEGVPLVPLVPRLPPLPPLNPPLVSHVPELVMRPQPPVAPHFSRGAPQHHRTLAPPLVVGAKRKAPKLQEFLNANAQKRARGMHGAAVHSALSSALAFAPRLRGKPRVWELKTEAYEIEPLTPEEFNSLSNVQLQEIFADIFERSGEGLPPGERSAPPCSSNRGWFYKKLVERKL